MVPTTTDVLVVGAGPTGLAVATVLALRGVDVTVVDGQAEGANTSRAAVVHARTLEVLATLGVSEELTRRGLHAPLFTIRDRDRVLVPVRFDHLPTRYPYALMVSQAVTEEVLLRRFTELGGRVHRPLRLKEWAQREDGITATLDDGQSLRARYLVGADGMHSTVREGAGIGFGGSDTGESFSLADVRITGGLPTEEVVLFFAPMGLLVSAPLPDGSFRLVAAVDEAPERPDTAYVEALLRARGPEGVEVKVQEVLWGSRFRVHHRVADRFRVGRVLLAGDAAHVHSPAGGQGMNLGLQDAVALGEALAEVLAGAPETRLDGYEARRRPIAQEVVSFAHRLTRLATMNRRVRPLRNTALRMLSRIPTFQRRLAWQLSGLVYR